MIFIVFMLGMGAVFGYGIYYEKLSHVTIGWDSDGNGCGYSPGFEEHNYLYFGTAPNKQEFEDIKDGNLIEKKNAVFGLLESGVCVSSCPKTSTDLATVCKGNTKKMTERGCVNCECDMYDVALGVDVPFRYDTLAVGLYGNGLCVPYISPED